MVKLEWYWSSVAVCIRCLYGRTQCLIEVALEPEFDQASRAHYHFIENRDHRDNVKLLYECVISEIQMVGNSIGQMNFFL